MIKAIYEDSGVDAEFAISLRHLTGTERGRQLVALAQQQSSHLITNREKDASLCSQVYVAAVQRNDGMFSESVII